MAARDNMVEQQTVQVGEQEQDSPRRKRRLPVFWWLIALGVVVALSTITFASGLLPIPQTLKSIFGGSPKPAAGEPKTAQSPPPAPDTPTDGPVWVEVGPVTRSSPSPSSSPSLSPDPSPSPSPSLSPPSPHLPPSTTPAAAAPASPAHPPATSPAPQPVPVPTQGNPAPVDDVPASLSLASSVNVALSSHAMAPGDTVVRSISVRNTGTIKMRYALVSQTDIQDGDVAASVLRLTVKDGVGTCTAAGFDSSGRVLYHGVLGSTSGTKILGDPAAGPHPGDRVVAPGGTDVLCVRVHLPATVGNALQGKSTVAALRFFAEDAR